jgi:glutathione synthase/RimK-type ligase-like ATP-grasp enzyme
MDRLGLVYGAIDMRLTPEGEYVFLEINPTGQWLFIEAATGQPIAAAFADLLIQHDVRQ